MSAPVSETFPPPDAVVNATEEGFWRGSIRVLVLTRLDGCLEPDVLCEALGRLQRRHPKLRATVVPGSDGRLRYQIHQDVAPIPVDVKDYSGEEPPWRDEAAALLGIAAPPAGPLAVVRVLRNRAADRSELILSVHHGIADGRSAITLIDDLLTEYANVQSQLEALPELPLVTATRARVSGGWRGRLHLASRFLSIQRAEKRTPQAALPVQGDIALLSQWELWVLSRAETLHLVRRCRKERVSPIAVLVAAVYCGIRDCLPGSTGLFKWHCPFDIRETLDWPAGPVTPQDLGSFIGMMRGVYRLSGQVSLWELARRAHEDVQTFVQYGGPAFGFNLARLAVKSRFPQPADESKRPTLLCTNYGVVALCTAYGQLRPRECTLMFKGDPVTGPLFTMEAMVLGDRLNVGFAADGLEGAFWERLRLTVRAHLNAAATGP